RVPSYLHSFPTRRSSDLELSADYGSIKINRLNNNASKVLISSDYVGIKIGLASDYAFNFEIDLEYASLRDAEGFEFSTKNIQSRSEEHTSELQSRENLVC